ncbi:MAG: hypothetical protein AAF682_26375 [Planctomycetota bacterium]
MKLTSILVSVALAVPAAAQCEYAQLLPIDEVEDGDFGHSVSIHGAWLAVGQTKVDPAESHVGGVYLYERIGGTWFFRQELASPEPGVCRFGTRVALAGDVLAVGEGDGCWVNAVWLFERVGGVWSLAKKVESSSPFDQEFGRDFALAGGRLAVGDPGLQEVYVFEDGPLGWQETATIPAPVPGDNAEFGHTLVFAGETLFVGDRGYGVPAANAGAVFVYEPSGGAWAQTQTLQDAAPESFDFFGWVLSARGDVAVVGSSRPSHEIAIFERIAGTFAPAAGNAVIPTLGLEQERVAVGADAILVGEPEFDGLRGRARVLRDGDLGWGDVGELQPVDLDIWDHAGWAVALDGDHAALASYGFDDGLLDVGAITAHTLSGELCYTLEGYPKSISLAAGGTATLLLDAGSAYAGALYGVAGTLSGTSPGLPVGALQAPLNPDAYFALSIQAPAPLFEGTVGLLDAQGKATARVNIAAGTDPSLAGLELHHAYLALGPAGGVELVSNAWRHLLAP